MSEIDIEGGPQTEAQFEQFLDEAGIQDWLLDATPEGEEPADTVPVAVEQPRDDQGRFMAQGETEEGTSDPPEEGAEPVVEPEVEGQQEGTPEAEVGPEGDQIFEIDPTYGDLLQKYGGDINKALGALNESQSMIGRQGSELGEVRQQLTQLTQMIQQQPQSYGPYQSDIDEDPRALVFESLDRGDGDTMQQALKAWGELEPFEAAQFLFALPQMLQDIPQPQQTSWDQPQQGNDLQTEMAAVVQRHPDVEKYLPQVGEVAKEFPTLRGTLEQGSPAQKAQAFEELVRIAKSREATDTSSAARTRAVLKAQEEARHDRAEASVVSARQNAASAGKQSGIDEFHRLFREHTGQPEEV